jgi:hypothetical protein
MSPTSYQAAPPRNLIVAIEWSSVKPLVLKDVEITVRRPILVNDYGALRVDEYLTRWGESASGNVRAGGSSFAAGKPWVSDCISRSCFK